MFKCIIVAVDGSDHSDKALEYAKGLAETFASTVWLVHAFPHTSDLIGYDEYEQLVARREGAGQAILSEARQKLADGNYEIYEELLEGPAAEAIISAAQIREADLIIMGSRGLGSLQGLLFGSVSSKVTHYATCPVMVVR